ncbi:MAG: hypothetical protein Q8N04_19335 [Nitrospira sp.]|nr:hypothetical protein [Nitrospira sp.]
MITQLMDGRFRVSVRCADNKTRWRICAYEGAAQFYEAILLAGWYDDFTAVPRRKRTRHA